MINFINDLIFQLNSLSGKAKRYIANSEYVYPDVFRSWVNRFNDIIISYNREVDGQIHPYKIDIWDFSTTQKTMKKGAVDDFIATLDQLVEKFQFEVNSTQRKEKEIPYHQLRKCFKIGTDGCSVNPQLDKDKVFIGMPFQDKYNDSYEFGIKLALESVGFRYYRADSEISNLDIMCKICREIQSCGFAIFNISGLNPNVMLELGLAYGIGKPVIIIKDAETKSISDIGSLEYIEYAHANDLMKKLVRFLEKGN